MIARPRVHVAAVGLTMLLSATTLGGAAAQPAPPPGEHVHEVKAGETLSHLAKRYGVTVAAIVIANHLRSAAVKLKIGQRLSIPAPTPTAHLTPLVAHAAPPAVATTHRVPLRPPPNLTLALPDFSEYVPLFTWPVEGSISSAFGRRRMGWHRGVDIKADLGIPIVASAPGVVMVSGYQPRYGRVIKIEHAHGFVTVYAHNDENMVDIGDKVVTGQRIALVGRTGRATAHHLHFEIRQFGLAFNPLYMLPLPRRIALVEETDEEEGEHDE